MKTFFVGIDISKDWLDVEGKLEQVKNKTTRTIIARVVSVGKGISLRTMVFLPELSVQLVLVF